MALWARDFCNSILGFGLRVVHAGKHGQCCCANSRPCRGTWCVSALARFPVCSFGVVAQVPSMVSDTKLDSKSFLSSRTSHR